MQSTRFPFEDFEGDETPESLADSTLLLNLTVPAPVANQNDTLITQVIEKVFTKEELEAAKKTAFEEGKTAGVAEGKAAAAASVEAQKEALNQKLAVVLESLNVQLATFFGTIEPYTPSRVAPLIHQLALGVAKKVVGESLKESVNSQIEHYINHSMGLLFDQPQLTIYLHPELEAPLTDMVKELAVKHNFRGEITIKPDSNLTESDCRLDWQDGFSEISKEEMWNAIQKALDTSSN